MDPYIFGKIGVRAKHIELSLAEIFHSLFADGQHAHHLAVLDTDNRLDTEQGSDHGTGRRQPAAHAQVFEIIHHRIEPDAAGQGYVVTQEQDKLYLRKHQHSWAYTASGTTITAACTNAAGPCPDTNGGSVTLSAPDQSTGVLFYNGMARAASCTSSLTTGDAAIITYYAKPADTTALSGAPVNAGDYIARIQLGEASVSVSYTIEKVRLLVTANSTVIDYGTAPMHDGVSCQGFVNNEDIDDLGGTPTYAHTYRQFDDVGEYTITPGGLTSDNYDISFLPGTLEVRPRTVTLAWHNTEGRIYADDEGAITATVSNAVNGDRIGVTVTGGERIALIGDNGTGKSTLIKMIMGEEYPDEGRIKLGPSTKIAYLPQIIHFDVPQRDLVDTMLYSKRDITPQKARDRLAAFHFRGEDVFKSVSVLSGGEQSRLRLCMLMDDEVNFLILDEPTNHLDIASREWIEEAVEAFDGTLLFVSHDRYFINRFATRVWELAEGTINDYPMGFAQYRAVKAQEKAPQPVKAPEKKGDTRPPRGNRSQQAARRQLTICETGISKLEAECRRLDEEMAAHACDAGELNRLYQEKQEVEARLEQEMARWEELSLQIEE